MQLNVGRTLQGESKCSVEAKDVSNWRMDVELLASNLCFITWVQMPNPEHVRINVCVCFSASTRPETCWTLSWLPWLERATAEHTGWDFIAYLTGLLWRSWPHLTLQMSSRRVAALTSTSDGQQEWFAFLFFIYFSLIIEGAVFGNILEIKPDLCLLVVCVFIPSTFSSMPAIEIYSSPPKNISLMWFI